jgi:hypothetical protein
MAQQSSGVSGVLLLLLVARGLVPLSSMAMSCFYLVLCVVATGGTGATGESCSSSSSG